MKEFIRKTQEGMKKTPLFSKSLGIIGIVLLSFLITIFLFINVIEDTQSRATSVRINALQSGLIEFLPDALLNKEYTLDRLVSFASADPSIGNIRVVEFINNQPIVTVSFDESEVGNVADGFASLISLATTDPTKSFTVRNETNEGEVLLTAKTFSNKAGDASGVLVITHIPTEDVVAIDTNMSFVVMSVITMAFLVLLLLFWHLKMFSQFTVFNSVRDMETGKDDFLKIISNALRAPVVEMQEMIGDLVTIISGNVQGKKVLSKMNHVNEGLNHFVESMLEATKLRQQSIKFSFDIIDPNDILEDIVDAFSKVADKKGIQVTKAFPTDQTINVDPLRLKQSILHVLSFINERLSENGTIDMETSVNMESLVISIHDSGNILSKESQRKMFEQFFVQDEEDLKNIGLTQMQLWIAYEGIRQMGGMLSVSSDKSGATFTITFPIQEDSR